MFRFTPEMASRLRFIKPTKAARIYGMHINTIYSKVKNHTIAYIKIDGSIRIAVWADDYQQWLEEHPEYKRVIDDEEEETDEEEEAEEDSQ